MATNDVLNNSLLLTILTEESLQIQHQYLLVEVMDARPIMIFTQHHIIINKQRNKLIFTER